MARMIGFAKVLVLVGASFVGGCASAATAEGMIARSTATAAAPSPEMAKRGTFAL